MDRTCRIVDVGGAARDERQETGVVEERASGVGREGKRERESAPRVGAFENVISIIARWFREAVQARNA